MKRPNILYIFTDQQSADAMSCAGNEELHTPNMDRLAAAGVRFERAYCTYPLCTPSRASMFTGQMPHEVGVERNGKPIAEEFRGKELGILLSNAGYDCAYAGKWHIPEISIPDGHGFRNICKFNDIGVPRACAEFMAEDRDQPFFLVASFDNPHNICEWRRQQNLPWGGIGDPPSPEDCPPLPANFMVAPFESEAIRVSANANPHLYPGSNYTPEQWRRYRWTYNRLVEKVDAQVGAVLDALDKQNLAKNTLVIFSSDHGDLQGAHHLVQKTFMYDESTRVPLILRLPDGTGAGTTDAEHLVSSCLDIYATICETAGVSEETAGKSLCALLRGDEKNLHDHVVAESLLEQPDCSVRMIRTSRFKYVAHSWGAYREQLFDMERDPGEIVNLAVRSSYADVLQHHRELLRAHCERTKDRFYGRHYSHPNLPFIIPGDEYPQSG